MRSRNEPKNFARAGSDNPFAGKQPIFSIACDICEWADQHIEAPRAARRRIVAQRR
jgi:hypothetical protein